MTSPRADSQHSAPTHDTGAIRGGLVRLLLQKLFALKSGDRAVLALVAPVFFVVTAASVIVATFTRAVFLTDHDVATLPLMFLGSAVFTALVSIGYVAVIERVPLVRRFIGLLVLAEITFAALHLAYPIHPKALALAQLVWCTGISHLILIQTWNMTTALVPARQGKRLFPVLAAVSTLGAAAGGGLVSLLLRAVEARHLLFLVLALLAFPLLRIDAIVRAVSRASLDGVDDTLAAPTGAKAALPGRPGDEIARGFRSIVQTPLLLRLAGIVFLLQIASLILDFQFSTELKTRYDRDALAGFLGSYYGISNLVAFVVALFASGRIVRTLGVGLSITGTALLVAVGSAAYLAAAVGGLGTAFVAIVATSFTERIGQFALSRNAMQVLVAPLETRKGERAKTLIDGVVYRVATVLVSIFLLFLVPTPETLGWLAPGAILACLGAVALGWSIGPYYRRALFEGLRARRVDSDADPQTRALVLRSLMGEVRQRLGSGQVRDILQALDMVRESKLPLEVAELQALARMDEPEIARRALERMNELGLQPERGLLLGLLTRDRPPGVLREVLRLLGPVHDPALIPLVSQFVHHADVGVARLAVLWLKGVGGVDQTTRIHEQLLADLKSHDADRRARAAFISGGYVAEDAGLDLARMLDDPSQQVRLNAVQSMGQIGSPEFIEPLVRCLGRGDLVQPATNALYRYGPDLIGSIAQVLRQRSVNLAIQLRLLRLVERFATPDAVALLMSQVDSASAVVRNHAVLSLWRMAREPDRPRPPRSWVRDRVLDEIALLQRYQTLELQTAGRSPRHDFFLAELQALRLQADMRAFRLLGLLLSRAAMHRAYLHYRSPQQRVRSNSIELLDQHIVDPALKPFVALVERVDTTINITGYDLAPPGTISTGEDLRPMLDGVESWLGRVWHWADATREAGVARDAMDLVFLLKGVPLLSDLSGEQLLPLTDIAQTVHVEAGDLIFAEGQPGNHLYVILDGEVEVLHSGERVATLGTKECFGEMALLDQSLRSASCRARKDVELLAIARDDFQDLLDLHPALARGIIRVLTQRLRVATEAAATAADG